MRAASRPKSIRAVQKVRLEHGFHDARDRTLNQSVFDRGNAQGPRSDFARTFRNLHPTYRWRPIGPCFQSCANILDSCLQLALELPRRFPVHPARAAPVHLPPGLREKRWCQRTRQRGKAQCAVCLGLGRNLFQLGGLNPRCGMRDRLAAEAVCVQGTAYSIGMQVQLSRNGTDLPMLGMKDMADVGDLLIGNHASPREKDSPSAPGVRRSDRRPGRPPARWKITGAEAASVGAGASGAIRFAPEGERREDGSVTQARRRWR
jgi:hypothetical protein